MKESLCLETKGRFASVSGIVLAGGESRRMGGVNKALLEIGGRRLIERVTSSLSQVFREVIIISNTPEEFQFLGLPIFRDLIPSHGSLGGLYTGLRVCTTDYGFLVACDMPFLRVEIIRHILSLVKDYDVVIPRISGHLEPLHAIYSRRCLPHIEDLLQRDDLKILNFLPKVNTLEVPEEDLERFDPELRFRLNLNTPEDLEKARESADEFDVV